MRPLLYLIAGIAFGSGLGGRSSQPKMENCRQQVSDAIQVAQEWEAISKRLEKTATECLAMLREGK